MHSMDLTTISLGNAVERCLSYRVSQASQRYCDLLLDPQDYKLVVRTREMIQVMQVWAPLKVAYKHNEATQRLLSAL